jgi:hypothetical protein
MKVRFIAVNPREKARPQLDDILMRGADQIAIACAFLTGGGAEVIKHHASRLALPDSFLVVAWETPTDPAAVEELHDLAPGHVYYHLGAQTPHEIAVGRGLMHSKVFLARMGNQCWLWIGSHNLTASAMEGGNCEAAVILEGSVDEEPFRDALAHLNQCRDEAIVFDPFHPPAPPGSQDVLIIHAECQAALSSPPWFVHLRPSTTKFDRKISPPGRVWLYLYSPGALSSGFPQSPPKAAYSGARTGINFTDRHPAHGIPADWADADYVIKEERHVFHMRPPGPQAKAPTQGVFRIETEEDPTAVWLSVAPTPKLEPVVGSEWPTELDPGFERFFTPASVRAGQLVHREYRALRRSVGIPRRDIGAADLSTLMERLHIGDGAEIEVKGGEDMDKRFAFLYRAKYRV